MDQKWAKNDPRTPRRGVRVQKWPSDPENRQKTQKMGVRAKKWGSDPKNHPKIRFLTKKWPKNDFLIKKNHEVIFFTIIFLKKQKNIIKEKK